MSYNITFVATGDPTTDTFPDVQTGGSGPIWQLANYFASNGHDVTIYSGTYDKETKRVENGVTIVEVKTPPISNKMDDIITNIPYANYIFNLKSISGSPGTAVERLFSRLLFSYRVKQLLKNSSPDVVYFRDRFSAFFPLDLDYPTVYTVKSPDACDFFFERSIERHPANHFLFRYKKFIEEHNIRNANKTIVMNPQMKLYYQSKGLTNIEVVPNGIQKKYIHDNLQNDREDRILFVGRLDANKRPEWLIHGYNKSNLNGFEIHFVGSGQREEYLKQQVQQNGLEDTVVFHGRLSRDDVLNQMRQATVLVLPSEFEVFGNVIIEAMASGCSVLASNTCGAQYLITHGQNGLLFDKEDVDSLARQMNQLTDNSLRRQLAKNGLKYVKEKHTTDEIATQYLKSFEDINPYSVQI